MNRSYSTGGKLTSEAVERAAARNGCEALLRAHLRTGKHWLVNQSDFDAACRTAGLAE